MTSARPDRVLRPTGVFRLLALALVGFLATAPHNVSAKDRPVTFDIPAQPASAALKLFTTQSGFQVVFIYDDLKDVISNEVTGEMEPTAALKKLLAGTGLKASQTSDKSFSVGRDKASAPSATGSVKGVLAWPEGQPAEGVNVFVRETGQSTETDKFGQYLFTSVAPGTYLLIARSEGYQPMHITDVKVSANQELVLSKLAMRKADEVTKLEPYVVEAEGVTKLEKYEVEGSRPKPFTDRNVDIPRGIDDAQPYYIFDNKTIEQSGAINVEDFLKERLTMNTVSHTALQQYGNQAGATSTVNLRGLGSENTLILVDGRRMAGVQFGSDPTSQTDVNGIPFGAIDRIEILPASASGIYGGSAVGGVINIILKKEYTGGEIKATYGNTWDSDAPVRSLAFTFGQSLEDGKTHLLFSAQIADAKPLLLQDRMQLLTRGYVSIRNRDPDYFGYYTGYTVAPGTTPNILGLDQNFSPTDLTLKGTGASLNSSIATLPAGFSPSSSPSSIIAGRWNLELPETTLPPSGLLSPLGNYPKSNSLMATLRRKMTQNLELFVDYSRTYSQSLSPSYVIPFFSNATYVPASSPTNPFNQDVLITVPTILNTPLDSSATTTSITAGAILTLPRNWTFEADYTWSQDKFDSLYFETDAAPYFQDLADGRINPFVDTLKYPLDLTPYIVASGRASTSTLNDLALRASGPLAELPWGEQVLTIGVEHRKEGSPDSYGTTPYAGNPYTTTYFGHSQATESAYLETSIPIVTQKNRRFLLNSLDLQAALRIESYQVSTGTASKTVSPGGTSWSPQTPPNDAPVRAEVRYASTNSTIGLKYKPADQVAIRASYGTAFLPPTYSQLLPNPIPDSYPATITDPKTGATYDVQTISGGNPNLKPQTSKNWNVGVIWEPQISALKGLRAALDFYYINQANRINGLSPQQIIDNSDYSARVTRDSGTGLITQVDTSLLNLAKYKSDGFDLSLGYRKDMLSGVINLNASATVIEHERRQDTIGSPLLDYVGWVNEGGEAKTKANITLTWERRAWVLGWTTRYYGSYMQNGAPGDPLGTSTFYTDAQGADHIPSQVYHDLFASFAFGEKYGYGITLRDRFLKGLTVQVGLKNVFNKLPPLDVYNDPFYYSYYGDVRLREYTISLRKQF